MENNIEVSLALGAEDGIKLTASFSPEKLEGKTGKEIVDIILNKEWQGEDREVCETIKRIIDPHYGCRRYGVYIKIRNPSPFIEFTLPLKINRNIDRNTEYIQDILHLDIQNAILPNNSLKLVVEPYHVL